MLSLLWDEEGWWSVEGEVRLVEDCDIVERGVGLSEWGLVERVLRGFHVLPLLFVIV